VDPRDHLAEPMWKEFCGEDEDRKFGDLEPWERDEFRAMVLIAQDYYEPRIGVLEAELDLLRRFARLQNTALGSLSAMEEHSLTGSEEVVRKAQGVFEQDRAAVEEFWTEHKEALVAALGGKP
jgi:hypothetical protein